MGIQDELKLIEIKEFANSLGDDYNFVIDDRNLATSILIDEYGACHVASNLSEQEVKMFKDKGWKHFVPDLIDYQKMVIIEYQESAKKTGKHTVKGHDELSDADKDLYYSLAGFRQIKIWDYDKEWRNTLKKELIKQ